MDNPYGFLLETYETEILKIVTTWGVFPEDRLEFRPVPKARSVVEQMEHQVQSEGRWMAMMLGIDTGDPNPQQRTAAAFIDKYRNDASKRLEMLRSKPPEWWQETAQFFDVPRSRAWVMMRRMMHASHHRGQLVTYIRLLGLRLPSVYGPTADTGGTVMYSFPAQSDAA